MTRTSGSEYDPSLRALTATAEAEWGDPGVNRASLVPYPGVPPANWHANLLNHFLWGIDIHSGELISIVGMEKSRKTTFALNIFFNIYVSEQPASKPHMAYLTLESGQPPSRVRDIFISMEATRRLADPSYRNEWKKISPEFLRYNTRHPVQMRAIQVALHTVGAWDINIYGPRREQGNTRDIQALQRIIDREAELGCKLIVLDHAQQVRVPGVTGTMQQLYAVVDLFAGAIVAHGMAGILISQVSLTSVRSAHDGTDRLRAVGGKRLDEESNVVFITRPGELTTDESRIETGLWMQRNARRRDNEGMDDKWEDITDLMVIEMTTSRRSPPFIVRQPVNRSSGLFVGIQTRGHQREYA